MPHTNIQWFRYAEAFFTLHTTRTLHEYNSEIGFKLVNTVAFPVCLSSIMNSLVIVLFLSGMVAMIMLRTLHKDIARYNQVDQVKTFRTSPSRTSVYKVGLCSHILTNADKKFPEVKLYNNLLLLCNQWFKSLLFRTNFSPFLWKMTAAILFRLTIYQIISAVVIRRHDTREVVGNKPKTGYSHEEAVCISLLLVLLGCHRANKLFRTPDTTSHIFTGQQEPSQSWNRIFWW